MQKVFWGDKSRVPELVREYVQLKQAAQRLRQLLPTKLAVLKREHRRHTTAAKAARLALQDQRYISDIQKLLSVIRK